MIANYKFISTLHMLMDIMPSVATLNLVFQKQNIDIASISPAVDGLLDAIEKTDKAGGYYHTQFKSNIKRDGTKVLFKETEVVFGENTQQESTAVRRDFCKNLRENVGKRFPRDSFNLVHCFSVLAMCPLSFLSQEEVLNYGQEEIKTLADFFGTDKESTYLGTLPAIVDKDETLVEWMLLKKIVLQEKYPRASTQDLFKIIYEVHAAQFPNLLQLARIAIVLPLQMADVERGFSVQNLIKTSQRNRISASMVHKLMLVDIEGESIDTFDFKKAVDHWKSVKDRNIFK